jgi:hypothetical protein
MSFTREGYPLLITAVILAALTFGLALRVRSWPIWLAAFALLLLSLIIAWFTRSTTLASALVTVPSVHG